MRVLNEMPPNIFFFVSLCVLRAYESDQPSAHYMPYITSSWGTATEPSLLLVGVLQAKSFYKLTGIIVDFLLGHSAISY
jgi:hypothetical protein